MVHPFFFHFVFNHKFAKPLMYMQLDLRMNYFKMLHLCHTY